MVSNSSGLQRNNSKLLKLIKKKSPNFGELYKNNFTSRDVDIKEQVKIVLVDCVGCSSSYQTQYTSYTIIHNKSDTKLHHFSIYCF